MSYVREYKSDVFSMLMEDKANALQVYNLLNGTDYTDPEIVQLVTLEKGISLSIQNDAAFIVDYEMTMTEHQSSYTPNMALRNFFYGAAAIKDYVKNKNLYGREKVKIPMPHFVVFYNGQEERSAIEVQKLSDNFEKPTEQPELELICTIYNINPKKNDELLEKCPVLKEYTAFVEKVREYDRISEDVTEAVVRAIDYCINHNILVKLLKERRMEVLHAMTLDYTFERREELLKEEIEEQKRLVEEKDEQLSQKDEQISQQESQLSQKDEQISQQESQLSQKDEQISQQESQLSQKDKQLSQQEMQIQKLKKQIEELKTKAE